MVWNQFETQAPPPLSLFPHIVLLTMVSRAFYYCTASPPVHLYRCNIQRGSLLGFMHVYAFLFDVCVRTREEGAEEGVRRGFGGEGGCLWGEGCGAGAPAERGRWVTRLQLTPIDNSVGYLLLSIYSHPHPTPRR